MKGKFDHVKFREIIFRGKVSPEDFRDMYPGQSDRSLARTAGCYMKALEGLGLAYKNGGREWKVDTDLLMTAMEFKRIKEKIGYRGSLYDFITELFSVTKELLRRGSFIEVLAEDYGVDGEFLKEFIEEFLDNIEWKREDDLRRFLEDFKRGLWVRLGERNHRRFREENFLRIKELEDKGFTHEEAFSIVFNTFLNFVPLSLELWEEVLEDCSAGDTKVWVLDRLVERKAQRETEFVPVNRTLYRKMQEEVSKLLESQREALKVKLTKRLNNAIEKTYREAKQMQRKLSR